MSAPTLRRCGAKRETVARPLPDFETLGLAKADPSDALYYDSLAEHLPDYAPLDQGPTSSCYTQAWCLGEVVTMSARYGITSPLPARRVPYYWARLSEGIAVTDDGCRGSSLMLAVAKHGIPPESVFPWDPNQIDRRPPMSARWDARDHVGKRGSVQIYNGSLGARIDAVQAAVASGRAFIISIPVGNTFDACDSAAAVEWPKESTIRGYHAVLGLGCPSSGLVEIVNSWGPGFGVHGRAWLAPEYLARSSSIIVVDPQKAIQ